MEELVLENIKTAIKEELGIADEVKNLSKNLGNEILNNLTYARKQYNEALKLNFKKNSFKFEIFDEVFTINYTCFFCRDSNDYLKLRGLLGGKNSYNERMFYLNFAFIYGQVEEKSFYDTIQHEVEHIYQIFKKGDSLISSQTINQLYNISANILTKGTKNEIIYKVAQSIYISMDFEQDAFVNGLYSLLLNSGMALGLMNVFKESDCYAYFKILNQNYMDLNNSYTEENDNLVRKTFGISLKTVLYSLQQAIKRFENKIGKVYIKAHKDLSEDMHKRGYMFDMHPKDFMDTPWIIL